MTILSKDYYLIHGNGAKTLLLDFFFKCVCPFFKLDSLKILIGLNHSKCTDRTSTKSGFSLSSDIVPTRIDDES